MCCDSVIPAGESCGGMDGSRQLGIQFSRVTMTAVQEISAMSNGR
ncbi:MAG: hypothetical protein ACI89E_002250, partial [Planctomycetota bacterium]